MWERIISAHFFWTYRFSFSDTMAHNCIFYTQEKCCNRPSCNFAHPSPATRQSLEPLTRRIENYSKPCDRTRVHDRLGSDHVPFSRFGLRDWAHEDNTSVKRRPNSFNATASKTSAKLSTLLRYTSLLYYFFITQNLCFLGLFVVRHRAFLG